MLFYLIFLFLLVSDLKTVLTEDEECMNDEARLAVLHAHNKYRSKLACGEVTDANTTLPGGIFHKFIYNVTMEKLSQNTANCCEMKHSNDTLYGENLYASSYKMNITDALIAAVDMWFAEKDVCPIAANDLKATDAVWDGCGHTVPMMQWQSTQISCGFQICGEQAWCKDEYKCKTTTLVSCNYYNPAYDGNIAIYNPGNKCTCDTDCKLYENSTCEIDSGLCKAPLHPKLAKN
uniref:SCP domain-containing protein n=2 Tax=Meloidogyne enterolobii TaxID=390850 RepID=A0A6V7UTR2_MELEN|nr:unnamed protein product [Meloidogyne enterolobii]